MEHSVYVCSWSRSSDGFALWVKSHPQIRAEGATYADAELRLIETIQHAGGAIQAVLEFDPPLPRSAAESKYTTPEIYLISGDDCFQTNAPGQQPFETVAEIDERLKDADEYFQSPVCRKCKCASSLRSDKPLFLTYAPRHCDGAFGYVGSDAGTMRQILSEDFLALLSPEERQFLEMRPVKRKGSAKKFYELLGPAGPQFVGIAGLTISGWRCTQCNHRTWGYWVDGLAIQSFIAGSDWQPDLNGVFTVGLLPEVQLAVTADRWKEMVGRKGTRGFVSRLLGVVPQLEVIRIPELPTYEERLRESANRSGRRN